ncbi:MAG TPA: DUF433 domain-containing protein [Lamprocystis sp. (in: g-proteobacteria)]|nr:DUF433 domain-containing protein [Lamprocystis sp. (in: g-proteobacteria)]
MSERTTERVAHRCGAGPNGAHPVVRGRISVDSVVGAFLNGQTPESIAQSYPALTLDQVFGALTCYQAHHRGLDALTGPGEAQVDALRRAAREHDLFGYLQFAETRRLDA